MKKIKLVLLIVWACILSYTAPVCIGILYLYISGHGKGYAYDLGAEKDFFIAFGVIELIVWGLIMIVTFTSLCKKLYRIHKTLLVLPAIGFLFLFAVRILLMGWGDYLKYFGIGLEYGV